VHYYAICICKHVITDSNICHSVMVRLYFRVWMNFYLYCPYFFTELGEIWCFFYKETMFHMHFFNHFGKWIWWQFLNQIITTKFSGMYSPNSIIDLLSCYYCSKIFKFQMHKLKVSLFFRHWQDHDELQVWRKVSQCSGVH
jgi:hypothetical protein